VHEVTRRYGNVRPEQLPRNLPQTVLRYQIPRLITFASSDDVGQHQQDHYDQRHTKKPQNDRHKTLQLFASGNVALSNNVVVPPKFPKQDG
jgi:hypothetical protein